MYTLINVLVVTKSASYVATQISGDTQDEAYNNAIMWVVGCHRSGFHKDVTTASPVFFSEVTDKKNTLMPEQVTVGGCIREADRRKLIAK
jgi:hypothetical protein